MCWCISFPNILELRVPVPSDFREVDRLRPTFWIFMDFSDVKYWFWRQFWMLHFRTALKALKRCKSVCVWVRGTKLYIFLFIILSYVQWKNLFFHKIDSKKNWTGSKSGDILGLSTKSPSKFFPTLI